MKLKYRLGVDIGTNSIGWAMLELNENNEPIKVLNSGARIFSDGREPKTKTSLAVQRREARAIRRNRDRRLHRQNSVRASLIKLGLFPEKEIEAQKLKDKNPYELRTKALTEQLSAFDLGRAIYHLSQRRGFKSGKKNNSAEEGGKNFGEKITKLKEAIKEDGSNSLGEFLYKKLQTNPKEPIRFHKDNGIYVATRALYEEEFNLIIKAQSKYFVNIKLEDWKQLKKKIFFQRPLKSCSELVGPCRIFFLDKGELRAETRTPLALPSYQKYLINQNLANLKYRIGKVESFLSNDQIKILRLALDKKKTITFSKIRVKYLKLKDGAVFNLESERRKLLNGNNTAEIFRNNKNLGNKWDQISIKEQDEIVSLVLRVNLLKKDNFEENAEKNLKKILTSLDLSEKQIESILHLDVSNFTRNYGSFSQKALLELNILMEEDFSRPEEAVIKIQEKYNLSDRVIVNENNLPYYGKAMPESVVKRPVNRGVNVNSDEQKYGKIGNPTVHIGLGQLRRIVNQLIKKYGKPEEVNIEIVRDLKISEKDRKEIIKRQTKNKKNNEKMDKDIQDLGEKPNFSNRLKLSLWTEQNGRCLYSGQSISRSQLFALDNSIEVDHILPFSRSLDESRNNKVLCMREANQKKSNKTPYEAFSNVTEGCYNYDEILQRLKPLNLHPAKSRRFYKEATDELLNNDQPSFLARQLNDTAYLARAIRKYFYSICEEKKVRAYPGRLTALLRHHWGLNSVLSEDDIKNRCDHRHHAIDAVVVAMADSKYLYKISNANKNNLIERQKGKIIYPLPWKSFFSEVLDSVQKIIVSHKVDHGKEACFFEDTAYGEIKEEGIKVSLFEEGSPSEYNVVSRKSLETLSQKSIEQAIRDKVIRKKLSAFISDKTSKKKLEETVKSFSKDNNIKSVRLLKKKSPVIEIRHKSKSGLIHKKYYIPDGIHYLAIWKLPISSPVDISKSPYLQNNDSALWVDKKGKLDYIITSVNYYESNIYTLNKLKPHPSAKLIMKLHKRDTVMVVSPKNENKEVLMIVEGFSPANTRIIFTDHNVANGKKEKYGVSSEQLQFSHIRKRKLRLAHINEIGAVTVSNCLI